MNGADSRTSGGARAVVRGGIYWVGASASAGSVPGVAHPHLVVQDDVFNRSRVHTVIVCALTSNLKRANEPGNVLLDAGEGDLPKQSVVVVSQVSSIEKDDLGEYLGAVSDRRVDQVVAGMRFQQASYFDGRR
ncbi:type II toxin-antitoxin system PemK/MazF family toxin [Baekduia alba]|uniref:type II toxin-antitoxin system PemK/MazF family toxin n=1 Tax=Baekduia alba TaxID=2997333 RepID=UPI0032C48BB0